MIYYLYARAGHRADLYMSIIFHIDVNSAFLSWSALKALQEGSAIDLRTIPSIVGGDQATRHGIVVAKSIPAKEYGIKTAETVAEAFRKCPGLVMVAPDHEYYSRQSHSLMDFLSGICPVIEQASIDECYMDFEPIRDKYASPEAAAALIKDSVRDTFGFTVNIGISDRKVLAKMASDFKKPDLVHTLYVSEIRNKMWPLPVEDLYMCGKSSAIRLQTMGIRTIGDLAQTDPVLVESWMKKHGQMLWNFANGIDDSVVHPEKAAAKGVGNSTTLSANAETREAALPELEKLCLSVSRRLKKKNVLAAGLTVEIKYADFVSVSHQMTLGQDKYSCTNASIQLYRYAVELFDTLWNGEPIRLLGVRASRLTTTEAKEENRQMTLFDFEKETEKKRQEKEKQEKETRIEEALGKIYSKYGQNAVKKGSLSKQ